MQFKPKVLLAVGLIALVLTAVQLALFFSGTLGISPVFAILPGLAGIYLTAVGFYRGMSDGWSVTLREAEEARRREAKKKSNKKQRD